MMKFLTNHLGSHPISQNLVIGQLQATSEEEKECITKQPSIKVLTTVLSA